MLILCPGQPWTGLPLERHGYHGNLPRPLFFWWGVGIMHSTMFPSTLLVSEIIEAKSYVNCRWLRGGGQLHYPPTTSCKSGTEWVPGEPFCSKIPWFFLNGQVVSNINEHCECALHPQLAHPMATTADFYLPIGRRGTDASRNSLDMGCCL